MADSPWIIKATKRRRTTHGTPAASNPRKRLKTSTTTTPPDAGRARAAKASSTGKKGKQSTLTQIDFVQAASSFGDEETEVLQPLGEAPPVNRAHRPAGGKDRAHAVQGVSIVKPDATLTQMDFGVGGSTSRVAEPNPEPKRRQSKLRGLRKRNSTLTQMDFFDVSRPNETNEFENMLGDLPGSHSVIDFATVPSFDGGHDRKSSVRQARQGLKPDTVSSTSRSVSSKLLESEKTLPQTEEESQEYQPTPRKRRRTGSEPVTTRRTSRRSAAKVEPVRPPMIIQDSTDFVEYPMVDNGLRVQPMKVATTPTKSRDRIPSSETPESIRRSTRTQPMKRHPLGELSANTQITPRRPMASKTVLPAQKSPKRASPRSAKICVLKVPPKALLSRADDERTKEHDIWSLQATSSPKKKTPMVSERHSIKSYKERPSRSKKESGPKSLDNASPVAGQSDTQSTLPDLSQIFPDLPQKPRVEGQQVPTTTEKSTQEHNSATATPLKELEHDDDEDMLLNPEPINIIPELSQLSSDARDGLDSPVKNDTQYVHDLNARFSSPPSSSNKFENTAGDDIVLDPPQHASSTRRGLARGNAPKSPLVRSPLPIPRLVPNPAQLPSAKAPSSTPRGPQVRYESKSQNKSLERVHITHVPLNDTTEYHQSSSSSPMLPPAPSLQTQRSIKPMSMPQPSQVSTQAPSTQGLFPGSSQLVMTRTTANTQVERVTIKDSSSQPARPGEIQRSADRENYDIDMDDLDAGKPMEFIADSEDDGELDLDPSTFPLQSTAEIMTNDAHHTSDETTQTPTQKYPNPCSVNRNMITQESPVLLAATTRSQRDAKLEVITLPSSPQQPARLSNPEKNLINHSPHNQSSSQLKSIAHPIQHLHELENSTTTNDPLPSSPSSHNSSPSPRPLKRKYSPLPGYNNDTQSDFTQGGHVSAAYIHRAHEDGWLPRGYVPRPYLVKALKGKR